MIQDFLSHGISIPIGSSNKFTKKLVKILCQNYPCIDGKICNGNFITGPYWNAYLMT